MHFPIPTRPRQFLSEGSGHGGPLALMQSDALIRFSEAQSKFTVFGAGATAAVLDTGCFVEHRDFRSPANRVAARVNLTGTGADDDITDRSGHGTHVTGALAANGEHHGVAPACRIVPVKIINGDGSDADQAIEGGISRGLEWVLEHADTIGITLVCLAVGDNGNYTSDTEFTTHATSVAISALAAKNIPVVISAGNYYGLHATEEKAAEGMNFPAILRQCISVGAVYDEPCDFGSKPCSLGSHFGSPFTRDSAPDQLTIFTQRMEKPALDACGTDIFAPGSWMISTGITSDNASSAEESGTSQAAPIAAGVIALMQSAAVKAGHPARVPLKLIREVLRAEAVIVKDTTDATHHKSTGKSFPRVDAVQAVKGLLNRLAGTA